MVIKEKFLEEIRQVEGYLFGGALMALAILALVAAFSNKLSIKTYSAVAFVLVSVALIKTYFGLLRLRLAIVFAISAVLLWFGVTWLQRPMPHSGKYQAVFLSNGQVYFGHLENAQSTNPTLKDVYYLQSNQQNPQNTQNTQQNAQPNNQLSLVKLGSELHGPESEMVLKSDQIIFWENLKDSGKVVQAIKQNEAKVK